MRASKDRDTVQRLQLKEEAAAEYRSAIKGLETQQRNEANTLRASLEQEALSSVRQQVRTAKEAQEQQQAEIMRRASEEILERDRQLTSLKAAALASERALRSEQEQRYEALASLKAAEARAHRAEAEAARIVNQASSEVAESAHHAANREAAVKAEAEHKLLAATARAREDAERLRSADSKASTEAAAQLQSVMAAINALSSSQDSKVRDIYNLVTKLAERVDAQALAMSSPPNPPPEAPLPVSGRPVNAGKGSKDPWLDPDRDPWQSASGLPSSFPGKGSGVSSRPNPKSGAGSLPGKLPGEAPSQSPSPAPSEAPSSVNRRPRRSSPEPSDAGSSGGVATVATRGEAGHQGAPMAPAVARPTPGAAGRSVTGRPLLTTTVRKTKPSSSTDCPQLANLRSGASTFVPPLSPPRANPIRLSNGSWRSSAKGLPWKSSPGTIIALSKP